MKTLKMIMKTMFFRLIDGLFIWLTYTLARFVYENSDKGTDLYDYVHNLIDYKLLTTILIISLAVGVVKIIGILTGIIKINIEKNVDEDTEENNEKSDIITISESDRGLGNFLINLFIVVVFAILLILFTDVLNEKMTTQGETVSYDKIFTWIKVAIVICAAVCLQMATLQKSIIKNVLYYITEKNYATRKAFEKFFGKIITKTGMRIFVAILEIILCVVCSFILLFIGVKNDLIDGYGEEDTYLVSEWCEDTDHFDLMDKFNLGADSKGMLGKVFNIKISSNTYCFLKVFPLACCISGFILVCMGLGALGEAAVKVLGGRNNGLLKYDQRKPYYQESNGDFIMSKSKIGIRIFTLEIILLSIFAFVTGIFMPLYIIINLILGTIWLIRRGFTKTEQV